MFRFLGLDPLKNVLGCASDYSRLMNVLNGTHFDWKVTSSQFLGVGMGAKSVSKFADSQHADEWQGASKLVAQDSRKIRLAPSNAARLLRRLRPASAPGSHSITGDEH
jgi:hypothetical protein